MVYNGTCIAQMVLQKVFINVRTAIRKDPSFLSLDKLQYTILILDAVNVLRDSRAQCFCQFPAQCIITIDKIFSALDQLDR
ncbi:hypothetical protein D3C79_642460 [compost metagenome]